MTLQASLLAITL